MKRLFYSFQELICAFPDLKKSHMDILSGSTGMLIICMFIGNILICNLIGCKTEHFIQPFILIIL